MLSALTVVEDVLYLSLFLSLSLSQSSMDPELNVAEPIPQRRFIWITATIIASTLTIAILIPHGQLGTLLVTTCIDYIVVRIYEHAYEN